MEPRETKKDKGEQSLKRKKQKRIDCYGKDEADTKKIVSAEKDNLINLAKLDQNDDNESRNFTLGVFTSEKKSKEKNSKNKVTKVLSKKSCITE